MISQGVQQSAEITYYLGLERNCLNYRWRRYSWGSLRDAQACAVERKPNQTYSSTSIGGSSFGFLSQTYPSIPRGSWSPPSNLMNTIEEVRSSLILAWSTTKVACYNEGLWRLSRGNWLSLGTGATDLGVLPRRDGRRRAPKSCVVKGSAGMETVYGRTGSNSARSVGLALRTRGPRASGRKLRGTYVGGGWICSGARG